MKLRLFGPSGPMKAGTLGRVVSAVRGLMTRGMNASAVIGGFNPMPLNDGSPLIRLAQDLCVHLSVDGDPCNQCIIWAGEHLAPQRHLKADLRALIARWRKVAGEWEDMVTPEERLMMGYLATSETLRTMARDLEKLLGEDY